MNSSRETPAGGILSIDWSEHTLDDEVRALHLVLNEARPLLLNTEEEVTDCPVSLRSNDHFGSEGRVAVFDHEQPPIELNDARKVHHWLSTQQWLLVGDPTSHFLASKFKWNTETLFEEPRRMTSLRALFGANLAITPYYDNTSWMLSLQTGNTKIYAVKLSSLSGS